MNSNTPHNDNSPQQEGDSVTGSASNTNPTPAELAAAKKAAFLAGSDDQDENNDEPQGMPNSHKKPGKPSTTLSLKGKTKDNSAPLAQNSRTFIESASNSPKAAKERDPKRRQSSMTYRMTKQDRTLLTAIKNHKNLYGLTDAVREAVTFYIEANVSQEELDAAEKEVESYFMNL